MPELDAPDRSEAAPDRLGAGSDRSEAAPDRSWGAPDRVTVPVDDGSIAIDLPPDANHEEAAAIACAVGAHLGDRRRAALAAARRDETGATMDRWTLAGRFRSGRCSRWLGDVERGEEWTAAARADY